MAGIAQAAHADAAFGTDLYRQLAAAGNVVFSPAGIAAALRMALAGAARAVGCHPPRTLELVARDPIAYHASYRPNPAGARPGRRQRPRQEQARAVADSD